MLDKSDKDPLNKFLMAGPVTVKEPDYAKLLKNKLEKAVLDTKLENNKNGDWLVSLMYFKLDDWVKYGPSGATVIFILGWASFYNKEEAKDYRFALRTAKNLPVMPNNI